MNGLEEDSMAPQTFLYGCELEAGKDVVFNPDDEDFEHQLDLRMACVDPSTKDELHMVEVEGQDIEGQKIKAILVSLKPSALPSICLGGFTITPPVVFRLKAGSGPVHLSGQHLVMGVDQSFDEEDNEDEEEEEEEEVKDVKTSKKRPATSPADKLKKKLKMEVDDDEDEDDDEDDDDDEDEEEDDDDEEEDEEEESVVKATQEAKPKAAAQNGKSPKPSTPSKKEVKTPKAKGEKSPKTPAGPKVPLTFEQVQEKILEGIKKGVALPKVQLKFENFVKNSFKVSDNKIVTDLWKWSQTVKDTK